MVESFEHLFPTGSFFSTLHPSSQKVNSHVVKQAEDSYLITNRVHAT